MFRTNGIFTVGACKRGMTIGNDFRTRTEHSEWFLQWNQRFESYARIHRPSSGRALNMSDKRPKVSDGQISVDMLPYEVQQLVEVMSGLNPEWALEKWMSEQASNMLELIRGDLGREQMLIEQRLHRLHAIQGRLEKEKIGFDPQQRNIFDCFDLEVDSSLKGLGQRTANSQDSIQTPSIQEESLHPVNTFIELLPDDESDDPLLAVVCQKLLIHVESELGKGLPCATLETIFKELSSSGISPEEIDEALDYSLMNGTLLEIDDDCFVPLN